MSDSLVDEHRLSVWLDGCAIAEGEPLLVERLDAGRSNAMFTIQRGDRDLVLRRPAGVAVDRANEGMRREYRILRALDASDVPHPEAIALCEDPAVLGCTFFVMERVDGINPMPPLPDVFASNEVRAGVAFAMVDVLAAIHSFDWQAGGLSDLGRPDGFHERQVDRWTRQLWSYGGRVLPGIDSVAQWLSTNRPNSFTPTLMHGDFHMFNLLIAEGPPGKVTAVVDWETATIGDPLLDLAGFCEIWCPLTAEGWPSRHELESRYAEARGIELPRSFGYYDALYNFRMAVLLEGIHQRSLRDPTRPDLVEVGDRALANVSRALEAVSRS
ncbi:COG3173 Predicted aminoglycoside phosphotransferase [Acidimicrobiia bacterium]